MDEPLTSELAAGFLSAARPAFDRAARQLAQDTGLGLETSRAVLSAELADRFHGLAAQAVGKARDDGATWASIAEAFGLSPGAVRHRYDPATIRSHRESQRRRTQ